MKERPILFSAPMVRAILEGRKTQTRRVVKPPVIVHSVTGECLANLDSTGPRRPCPYGQPGDRLWVRETFSGPWCMEAQNGTAAVPPSKWGESSRIWYWADGEPDHGEWTRPRPSIHMPRWASRILLEITRAGVERLQGISEDDAQSEGVSRGFRDSYGDAPMSIDDMEDPREVGYPTGSWARDNFRRLWESINGAGSWDANPLVWVIEFKQLDADA